MKKKRSPGMILATIVMFILALVVSLVAYSKGQHVNGMKAALGMTIEIFPLLLLAFIAAGMVTVILPHELLAKWIGEESGFKGICVGTIAGALAVGGPYVSLPLIAGLLRAGASIGTMVAFLTAWSLWAIGRLPMEIGMLGWKFALVRFMSVFFFPPIAGVIAHNPSKILKW